MPELSRTSYDEVPYESHPYPQTHPDRLATVAKLLGLNPAMPDKCRVLELGCAGGGNLIPMAYGLPESQFLGVDLSRVQIDQGLEMIKALGLKNIQLRHQSIVDIGPDIGKFDYIICHGVYSWVPTAVQDAILGVCYRHLLPRGIAYISYNTYPGWHMRGMIRHMVSYHARQFAEPAMRVKQARNAPRFFLAEFGLGTAPYETRSKGLADDNH
jgi:cyclopropane fatty-acyl-phospholipid synthase-like methyltransferase